MKKLLIAGALFICIAGATSFFILKDQKSSFSEIPLPDETLGAPVFTWSYHESENDGIPYTELSLMATYENGTSKIKIIDRVEGSCNAYETVDSGIYERSTMVICYYAGLGRYFKVISDTEGYVVQRRIFEEASPDYNPPHQSYETVMRF